MTRLPKAGTTKTRLIPALGAEGAASLHDKLARHTLTQAKAFCSKHGHQLVVRIAGGDAAEASEWLREPQSTYHPQCPGNLGDRLIEASQHAFASGADQVLIIGTDCPSIDAAVYSQAAEQLACHDLVVGPATDGGYYLIGLTRDCPSLFENIAWSTRHVLAQTETAARELGLTVGRLATLPDVDLPEDLPHAESILEKRI